MFVERRNYNLHQSILTINMSNQSDCNNNRQSNTADRFHLFAVKNKIFQNGEKKMALTLQLLVIKIWNLFAQQSKWQIYFILPTKSIVQSTYILNEMLFHNLSRGYRISAHRNQMTKFYHFLLYFFTTKWMQEWKKAQNYHKKVDDKRAAPKKEVYECHTV